MGEEEKKKKKSKRRNGRERRRRGGVRGEMGEEEEEEEATGRRLCDFTCISTEHHTHVGRVTPLTPWGITAVPFPDRAVRQRNAVGNNIKHNFMPTANTETAKFLRFSTLDQIPGHYFIWQVALRSNETHTRDGRQLSDRRYSAVSRCPHISVPCSVAVNARLLLLLLFAVFTDDAYVLLWLASHETRCLFDVDVQLVKLNSSRSSSISALCILWHSSDTANERAPSPCLFCCHQNTLSTTRLWCELLRCRLKKKRHAGSLEIRRVFKEWCQCVLHIGVNLRAQWSQSHS